RHTRFSRDWSSDVCSSDLVAPTMWSSVFIIDPLYTVWLLAACVVAWFARARPLAQRALLAGLVLSSAYLGWSLVAKAMVDRQARSEERRVGTECSSGGTRQ